MPVLASAPATDQERAPLSYTPQHLAEKILTSRGAFEGERKQVTQFLAVCRTSKVRSMSTRRHGRGSRLCRR
jgi:hypothetical protein